MSNKVFQWTLHRELWKWLSENPECIKEQWSRWKDMGGDVDLCDSLCFACEYNSDRFDVDTITYNCKPCPLRWYNDGDCESKGSEYHQWKNSESPQERTRLALTIMDLPVKDGVVWE